MGAVVHALSLAHAMKSGSNPSPDDLMTATKAVANLPGIIQRDIEVGQYWRASFERESGAFADAWQRAIDNCRTTIQAASETNKQAGADRYAAIVDRLKLTDPAQRGNGMLTAVAAVGLTWCEPKPELALKIAANAIGTDTDSIATMAGAILGVNTEDEPPIEVLDAGLFRSEAERLSDIVIGKTPKHYQYPDLLHWSAPKTRADALVTLENGDLYVTGLGNAKALEDPIPSGSGFEWQWIRLELGQTLLIKRRKHLVTQKGKSNNLPIKKPIEESQPVARDLLQASQNVPHEDRVATPSEKSSRTPAQIQSEKSDPQPDIKAMIHYLEKHQYADEDIGRAMRSVAKKCTAGQIAAFLGVLIDRLRELPAPSPKQKT